MFAGLAGAIIGAVVPAGFLLTVDRRAWKWSS
jgi:hypothetical protein